MAARALLLLALAAALGACKLDPAGRCSAREECAAGLDCLDGVCAACRDDRDCSDWAACAASGLCEPRAGRCRLAADCASWEGCDAEHTCTLLPDRCPEVGAACAALEVCDATHACSLLPGRCYAATDCPAWMSGCDLPTQTCLWSPAASDDVIAWGTLAEGRDDRAAAARVTAPAKVEVGFDAGAGGAGAGLRDAATGDVVYRGFLDPATGALVYRHVGDPAGDTLRRMNRDEGWTAPASPWAYPLSPSANDAVAIDATRCPKTWDRWVMQAGTGEILYGCPGAGTWSFYGAAGTARATGVLAAYAWSAADRLLVRSAGGALRILAAGGGATDVTGLPTAWTALAYRTVNQPGVEVGFRVALHDDGTGADQLWTIDEVGGGSKLLGTYATAPGGYVSLDWEVLDAEGALYGRAWASAPEVVLKRPLSPGATGVIYDEAKMPSGANDFSAATFKPWLKLDRSFLFSRP
ncbi:MAG TPA: hypothetical protein VLT47_09710 [Anaeromyxobacteraceae bacterium]|nr:hypothetical protein [Anaeromyxobacteraceae bacterium]